MEPYHLLAIDPGINGFISVLKVSDIITPVKSIPIPTHIITVGKKNKTRVDEEALSILICNLINEFKIVEVAVEKQQAVANQGVTSTGTTMEHFGFLKGFLEGIKAKYRVVNSKTWQGIYPPELSKNKELTTKQKSEKYCIELYPTYNLKKTPRCTTVADGLTDSLLIGTWLCREYINN